MGAQEKLQLGYLAGLTLIISGRTTKDIIYPLPFWGRLGS